jgi:hypothetical protein
MIDFVSTFEGDHPKVEICVVYDERDGRIVHTHGFLGDGTGMLAPESKAEREHTALERAACHHGSGHLGVVHAPADFRFERNMVYRYDVKAGKLVGSEHTGFSLPELLERRRKVSQK